MTDHDAFLEAIVERSDDDTPRLMYADWLMERGDPRGEFIRVQHALAPLNLKPLAHGVPTHYCSKCGALWAFSQANNWWNLTSGACGPCCDNAPMGEQIVVLLPQEIAMICREQELLSAIGPYGLPNKMLWLGETCNRIIQSPETLAGLRPETIAGMSMAEMLSRHPIALAIAGAEFRRGFVSRVTLPHDVFLEHAATLFLAAPIEAVTLSDMKPRILGTTAAWHRGYRFRTPDPEDLDPAIWDCLALAVEKREPWCWYDTVEEANADLSNACVKLGRKRAAKLKKERVKS